MSQDEFRRILEQNVGFDRPDLWLGYAARHEFKRTSASRLTRCPDCASEASNALGQYVYYSTLLRLRECCGCSLVWADARIARAVVQQHFEREYKDDRYFRRARLAIFDQLANTVAHLAPRGACVLDIGGARGDLMATLVERRPDISATVNDISVAATTFAVNHFGLKAFAGDARALASLKSQFDVVVLSDVMYYEPNIGLLWSTLSRLLAPNGAIVIRGPNKLALIRAGQALFNLTRARRLRLRQDRIRFFNPEHIFVLSRRYLRRRLAQAGFVDVRFVPSPLLSARSPSVVKAYFAIADFASRVSRRRLVLTPSMLVTARQSA